MAKQSFFRSSEEVVSMFLGLVIVAVVAGLIFNYFSKKRGVVDIPGVTDQKNIDLGSDFGGNKLNTGSEMNYYIVKKGDNLWRIAEKNYSSGYKWTEIAKENNIYNPGLITVGQKLVLPVILQKEVTVLSTGEYKVIKGDSLWKISVRAYGDGYKWVDVWNNNKNILGNPNKLEIGMKLILPKLE